MQGSNYVKTQVKVDSSLVIELLLCVLTQEYFQLIIEGLCERTKYIDIFLFFCPSLNRVLFPMFCLLVEGECQILVF